MDPKELRGLYEAYAEVYTSVDEAVKGEPSERRADLAAERRAGHRPLPAKEGERYASHKMAQMAYAKRKRMGEEVEQLDEISLKTKMSAFKKRATDEFESDGDNPRNYTKSGKNKSDLTQANIVKKHGEKAGQHAERAAHAGIFGRKSFSMPKKPTNEELDIFDVVLEFLQAEGYAETLEEAEWMMANVIDEEAIGIILGEAEIMKFQKEKGDIEARMDSNKRRRSKTSPYYTAPTKGAHGADYRRRHNIAPTKLRSGSLPEEYVDEAQHARENPEKYEREQSKKYAPVRGEKTPMPPRGDKRREDFEKWYAANVR